jgi:predicted ABC-class ATPase
VKSEKPQIFGLEGRQILYTCLQNDVLKIVLPKLNWKSKLYIKKPRGALVMHVAIKQAQEELVVDLSSLDRGFYRLTVGNERDGFLYQTMELF